MIIRLIAYLGVIFLYCFITAFAVGVGVLSALKTFWKTDMNNGFDLVLDISTAIAMAEEHRKKKEEKNADKTGRDNTDR